MHWTQKPQGGTVQHAGYGLCVCLTAHMTRGDLYLISYPEEIIFILLIFSLYNWLEAGIFYLVVYTISSNLHVRI